MRIEKVTIAKWSDIASLEVEFGTDVYRGQSSTEWELESSLRRLFTNQKSKDQEGWITSEYYLLKEFRRRAQQYESNLPEHDDILGWLAMMQHYGTPTRFLDFTYSFYIALYFALMGAQGDAVIWAINDNFLSQFGSSITSCDQWLREKTLDAQYNYGNGFLAKVFEEQKGGSDQYGYEEPGLLMIEPEKQNPRLGIQQGLFIMQLNLHIPFLANIDEAFLKEHRHKRGAVVKKIVIKKQMHETAIMQLNRMNITAETLFPGIDGFARSLTQTVLYCK